MEGCAGVVLFCTVLCLSASIYIYSYIYRGISLSLKDLGTFLGPCRGAIVMALLTAAAAAAAVPLKLGLVFLRFGQWTAHSTLYTHF